MKEKKCISAQINKPFEVTLQSMIGSTCYSWSITKMPDSVFLLFTENARVNPGGIGPVNQKFTFAFNGTVNTLEASIEFTLLNLSTPSYTADKKKIIVDVRVINNNSEEQTDLSDFVTYSENGAMFEESTSDIPRFKYNYPSDASCVIEKYNFPNVCSTSTKAYAFPVGCCEPIMKYDFPMTSSNCSPVFKYNYPTSDNCCITKYNFPDASSTSVRPYGFPNECCEPVMKYDFPRTDGCCTLMYNVLPTAEYNYPCTNDCSIIKYSFPITAYNYPRR